MKRYLLFATLAFASACSANQTSGVDGQPLPMCMEVSKDRAALTGCCSSQCAGMMSACTERNGGDFSACSAERRNCETTCLGDEAQRGDNGRMTTEVTPPPPTIVRDVDAGASADASDNSAD